MIRRPASGRLAALVVDALIIAGTITLVARWSGAFRNEPTPARTTAAEWSFGLGRTIKIDDVDWHEANRTVLLALRSTCAACEDSVGYYRKLLEACATSSGCRELVVTREPADTVRAWLRANEIPVKNVVTVPGPAALGLRVTPTLAIIDSQGIITDVAVGALNPALEQSFLARTTHKRDAAPVNTERQPTVVDAEEDVPTLVRLSDVHLLDVRERDECIVNRLSGATCVPVRELGVRAPAEFARDSAMLVDCSKLSGTDCRQAVDKLFRVGFGRVLAAVTTGPAVSVTRATMDGTERR